MTQELAIERDLARWSRQRWILCVGLIFLLQVGGLFWAAEGEEGKAVALKNLPRVSLGNSPRTELMSATAVDPLIFGAADMKGFSGPGWLEPRPWNYAYDGLVKKPRYVHYRDAAKILKEAPRTSPLHQVGAARFFEATANRAEPMQPWQAGQSELRVAGELAERRIVTELRLPVQEGNDIPGSSIVEAGVNRDGLVVSARLVQRSASKKADQEALGITRKLRFEPVSGRESEVTWGKLIFQWFAVELVSTNGAPPQ